MVTTVTVTISNINYLANNESAVVKTIICRWVKEGKVVKKNTNLWQKC